jgi:hypothetical protein
MYPPVFVHPELPWSVDHPGKMVAVVEPESTPRLSLKSSYTDKPVIWAA